MRFPLGGSLVAALALTLVACGSSSGTGGAQQSPLTVGVVAPLTGAGAVYGDLVKKGAQLAIEDVNKAGGIGGRKLQVAYGDDQLKPEIGVNETRRVIEQEHAAFVVTGIATSVALAQASAFPLNLLWLEAKADALTDGSGPYKNVLDANLPFNLGGELFFSAMDKQFTPKTVGLLLERSDQGTAQEKAARAHWGDKVADIEYFNLTEGNLSVPLTKLAAKKVDVIFASTSSDTILGQLLRQSSQFGITAPFLLSPGSQLSAQTLDATKAVSGGVYTADIYDPSISSDANKTFVAEFRAKYGADPGKQELITYEAITITAKAMASASCTDCTSKIVDLVKAHSFQTPRGTVKFSANGLGLGDKFFVFQFKDGAPKLIGSQAVSAK